MLMKIRPTIGNKISNIQLKARNLRKKMRAINFYNLFFFFGGLIILFDFQ